MNVPVFRAKATKKQIEFLKSHNIKFRPSISKREAFRIIRKLCSK